MLGLIQVEDQGQEVYVYRILDTQENKYWYDREGKSLWDKPVWAKHSWNCAKNFKQNNFNNQERFVTHKFSLTKELS